MLRPNRPFRFIEGRLNCAVALLLAASMVGCGGESGSAPQVADSSAPAAIGETEKNLANRRILFFGDSITAGYGLDPEDAFPALIQERIDELEWPYDAVNAGLSGETSAGGLRRIDWLLRQPVDVLVLELGGNDGLRGISPSSTYRNLEGIVEKVRDKNPDAAVVIAGMRMPPNLGSVFADSFEEIYPSLADEKGATLIPFIGENVIGRRRLLQMDGIHPTAAGHEVIAETVWEYLEPVLREQMLES